MCYMECFFNDKTTHFYITPRIHVRVFQLVAEAKMSYYHVVSKGPDLRSLLAIHAGETFECTLLSWQKCEQLCAEFPNAPQQPNNNKKCTFELKNSSSYYPQTLTRSLRSTLLC